MISKNCGKCFFFRLFGFNLLILLSVMKCITAQLSGKNRFRHVLLSSVSVIE